MRASAQLFWGGGLEIATDARLGFLRAKVLGGTTIVNQALLDRFDSKVWTDWNERASLSWSEQTLSPWYARAEKTMTIQTIREDRRNRNAKIFTQALDAHGLQWKSLSRGQRDCPDQADCIVCLGGCPRDSKQSTLVTAIAPAQSEGLDVRAGAEVTTIETTPTCIRVHLLNGLMLESKQVVLAAGALGTTRILLRSALASQIPQLGHRFSCHPQYMSFGVFEEPVDAHKGAFQAVKSADPRMREWGFKLENVFAGPIATAMLVPGFGRKHLDAMKRYRHFASMEVCIQDEPLGQIRINSSGKLQIDKPLGVQDRARIEKGRKLVTELFRTAGAREVIEAPQGFGLHLMGGCVIGADPKQSVVDPEFRLHADRRVWIADSSIFPSAPGINPSLTISALSVWASERMLAR
jgi:choline dehydrogenase-like flavoprotein